MNFTKGILPKPQISETRPDKKWANMDHDMMERLGNTRVLTKFNVKETVWKSEHDVVLFVYSSEKTHSNWQRYFFISLIMLDHLTGPLILTQWS